MQITLTNDFHNTTARIDADPARLTKATILRVRASLCGLDDCTCATSPLGTRGKQPDGTEAIINRANQIVLSGF